MWEGPEGERGGYGLWDFEGIFSVRKRKFFIIFGDEMGDWINLKVAKLFQNC